MNINLYFDGFNTHKLSVYGRILKLPSTFEGQGRARVGATNLPLAPRVQCRFHDEYSNSISEFKNVQNPFIFTQQTMKTSLLNYNT